jgi:hypothetical protein
MPVTLVKPYCTLAEVQAECRNEEASAEDVMNTAINLASRFIGQHCRDEFWGYDHTTTPLSIPKEWVAGNSIYFPWPIVSLSLLEDISNASSPVTVDADTYRVVTGLDANGDVKHKGFVECSGKFPSLGYKDCLRATGVFGYELAAVEPEENPPVNLPAAVRRSCVLIASTWSTEYRKQWKDADGVQQEMLQTNVPKEAMQLLSRWRQPKSF